MRNAAYARSACHLWLLRHVRHAELVTADCLDVAAQFLRGFVEESKASGRVAALIARHQVQGLEVAPAAGVEG